MSMHNHWPHRLGQSVSFQPYHWCRCYGQSTPNQSAGHSSLQPMSIGTSQRQTSSATWYQVFTPHQLRGAWILTRLVVTSIYSKRAADTPRYICLATAMEQHFYFGTSMGNS